MRLLATTLLCFSLATAAIGQQVVDDSVEKVGQENAKAAMASVMSQLKDPMSAQFSSFTNPDPRWSQYPKNIVCGMVNAKNGFGGYVGFSPFSYHVLNKSTIILTPETLSGAGGELAKLGFKYSTCDNALGVKL